MSEKNGSRYTPTEGILITLLSDGLAHSRDELLACLEDDQATYQNVKVHISHIRKKLRPRGEDIVCELTPGGGRTPHYRHVRLLGSAYAE
jgi:DNA-binding CsgD family transcriptional regulator